MLFLGDIHRNFKVIFDFCKSYEYEGNIIQVGDFGLGFNTREHEIKLLESINNVMTQLNSNLYVIRGNHDDPRYWNEWHQEFSNLHLVKDYTVLELEGYKMLCIGGALSVDRIERNAGVDYFPDEVFTFKPELMPTEPFDILVTHTSSDVYTGMYKLPPFIYGYAKKDANLLADLECEKTEVAKMFSHIDVSKLKYHFFGHFHRSKTTISGDCVVKLLNINEFYNVDNILS